MNVPRHGVMVRFACVATAIAVVAVIGGCGRSAPSDGGSGGVSTTLIAPTPGAPVDSVRSSTTEQYGSSGAGAPASDLGKGGATTVAIPVEKLVVVNKTLRIETEDVDAAVTKIRALASRDGGDITNMQVSTAIDQPVYPVPIDGTMSSAAGRASSVPLKAYVTVRVPSATYAAFIADAAKLGRVLFQSETADDVTQQHVDMQARLGNLKAEQSRLRQLFDKAKNVSDMLAIEQELTRVQGDIESWQAQISYLERQAAMATVTIELTEPEAIVSPGGTDWGVKTAFTSAVRAFVNTMNILIVLLGPLLALLVFIGLPAWGIVTLVRRAVRRARGAKAARASADAPAAPAMPVDPGPVGGPGTGA